VGALSSSGVVNAVLNFEKFDTQTRWSANRSGELCPTMLHDLNLYTQDEIYSNPDTTGLQIKALYNATVMPNDEFLFMFVDGIVESIQYGNRIALCAGLMPITDTWAQLEYLANFAAANNPLSIQDYWSGILSNTTIDMTQSGRQWNYQVCTQLGYFQTPPQYFPIRSRVLSLGFWKSYCQRIYGAPLWPDTWKYNTEYGATYLQATNIMYTNGIEDPWQWATKLESDKRDHYQEAYTRMIDCNDCAHCVDLHRSPNPANSTTAIEESQFLTTLLMLQWVYGDDPEVNYFPNFPPSPPNPPPYADEGVQMPMGNLKMEEIKELLRKKREMISHRGQKEYTSNKN